MFNKKGWCKNNPENLSTKLIGKHILSGLSMSTVLSSKRIEKNMMYTG